MTVAATAATDPGVMERPKRRIQPGRIALHAFLIGICLLWLFPVIWTLYTSLRPYEDTTTHGYVSFTGVLNFDNYINAWNQGEIPMFFFNTIVIVVPAVIAVLFLSSMIAFAVSRYSFRFNLALLLLFTAGNLLPPQVIITPLYRIFILLPFPFPPPLSDNGLLYDQYIGIALIHIAFQVGFCTFVLSNYMKTIPKELTEAAVVDGASVFKTYRSVILPLCKPALAALATLEFTFIYNDFFWALILMRTGNKLPITTALNNLKGQFFTDTNLLAAGAVIVALPTLIVFFALQKQFISGLTLGSTKG